MDSKLLRRRDCLEHFVSSLSSSERGSLISSASIVLHLEMNPQRLAGCVDAYMIPSVDLPLLNKGFHGAETHETG